MDDGVASFHTGCFCTFICEQTIVAAIVLNTVTSCHPLLCVVWLSSTTDFLIGACLKWLLWHKCTDFETAAVTVVEIIEVIKD